MSRRAWRVSVTTVLLLLGASGCGDGAPSAFSSRERLPTCGSFPDRRVDDALTAAERTGLECARAALTSGTGAEISYAFLTTEGDPIRYWMRVLTDGSVEMFEHSDDSFGTRGWTRYSQCDVTEAKLVTFPGPEVCATDDTL